MEYTAKVTDVDDVTKKIEIKVTAGTVDSYLTKEFQEVANGANIKGFRKGKAPDAMIEQLYGSRVNMEVSRKLVGESLEKAVSENSLHTVGDPELDFQQPEKGKDFNFTATVFLFPSPEIKGYESVSIEHEQGEVKDEDVEKTLNSLLDSKASVEKIKDRDVAQKGDVINADLTVTVEGEEAGQTEPLVVALGEEKLPPELEEGIVGLKIGETKVIEGALPAEGKDEEDKGKKATYEVVLNELSEKTMPEVTDELAKELSVAFGPDSDIQTVLELKLKIREHLENQLVEEEKGAKQAKVLEELLKKNDFNVPQPLVDNEIRSMLVRYGVADPKKMDVSQIPVESFREKLGEEAKKRVQTAVIVDRVAEQESLAATADDISGAMEEIAKANNIGVEEVRQYFASNNQAMNFTVEQTRNKVLDYLASNAKVKKKAA